MSHGVRRTLTATATVAVLVLGAACSGDSSSADPRKESSSSSAASGSTASPTIEDEHAVPPPGPRGPGVVAPADFLVTLPDTADEELVKAGRVHPYIPPRVAGELAPEHKTPVLTQRLSTKVLMYNEAANPNGAPVKNLWELTTPAWKGRVLMVDPMQRGELLDLLVEISLHPDEMAEAYQAQFGKVPDGLAALGYDAARLLFDAMDRAASLDGKDLAAAISATRHFPGVTGKITIDAQRNAEKDAVMLEVVDGMPKYLATISPQ